MLFPRISIDICNYSKKLESIILDYKGERLPIKINNAMPERRIMTIDEYEKYYLKEKSKLDTGKLTPEE